MIKQQVNQVAKFQPQSLTTSAALQPRRGAPDQIASAQLWTMLTITQRQALFRQLIGLGCALASNPRNITDNEEAGDEQH